MSRRRLVLLLAMLACQIPVLAQVRLRLQPAAVSSATCGLSGVAFCDDFEEGVSATRGRAGDLDPVKWGAGRVAPADYSGIGPVANPVRIAPIPGCRSTFNGGSATSVYPPDDTLICDANVDRSSKQLMTAEEIQNYGNNSYWIRQPFDFAGRTGKIVFDVDAVQVDGLAAYVALDITEDPIEAPTFQQLTNYETGPVPRSALMLKWTNNCGSAARINLLDTMVYTEYAHVVITPSFTETSTGCPSTLQGSLNHIEVQLSQTHIDVYMSDYSTDGGTTFSDFKLIYSATLSLPFTRGYLHFAARNHATLKYDFGENWINHWDNIGFDGPVLPALRAYEILDNTRVGTYSEYAGATITHLGWTLLDGTTGPAAGMYDPVTQVGPLSFTGVNLSGATAARLSFTLSFNNSPPDTTVGFTYRWNGGTLRTRLLTSAEVAVLIADGGGSNGLICMLETVLLADLATGTNTIMVLPVNGLMSFPPVIANIDLLLTVP